MVFALFQFAGNRQTPCAMHIIHRREELTVQSNISQGVQSVKDQFGILLLQNLLLRYKAQRVAKVLIKQLSDFILVFSIKGITYQFCIQHCMQHTAGNIRLYFPVSVRTWPDAPASVQCLCYHDGTPLLLNDSVPTPSLLRA